MQNINADVPQLLKQSHIMKYILQQSRKKTPHTHVSKSCS